MPTCAQCGINRIDMATPCSICGNKAGMQSQPLEPQRNHAYKQPATPPATEKSQVVVVDIKMPFSSMVFFMIKWVIASIPAFIILAILGGLSSAVIMGLFAALVSLSSSDR